MKRTLFTLMLATMVAIGVAATAQAQSTDPTLVKIPFSFVVNGKILPAGSYRITNVGSDYSSLLIENVDAQRQAVFATTERVADQFPSGTAPRVAFKSYAGQHFLWRISAGGEAREIVLHSAQMDRMLARLNLLPAEADIASK